MQRPQNFSPKILLPKPGFQGLELLVFTIIVSAILRETSALCRPHYVAMMVHYEDCVPARVLARTCYGSCPPQNGDQTNRTSGCCVPRSTIERRARVYCPAPGNETGYVETYRTVTLPAGCRCERCSPDD